MFVVQDNVDSLILWMPKGTIWKVPTTPLTRPKAETRAERVARCMLHKDWVLQERVWDVSTLWFMQADQGFAIWVSWLGPNEFWGWYVNLQEPFSRTPRTVQTMDLALDVLVEADRSWRWKDEDELEVLIGLGAITAAKGAQIRHDGESAIEMIKDNSDPFCSPWPSWRPPSDWGLPVLPDGWHRIEGREPRSHQ